MTAFLTAIDATANDNPEEFVKITRVSWASENAVVHRLLARGLASVSHAYPDAGLRYLKGDRRRFWLGTHESDNQSDSIALICAVARGLLPEEYRGLEELILSWSMYRDEVDVSEEQKVWNREQRIPLIDSIAEFLSPQAADLLRSEQASFPDWNRKRGGLRYGSVRVIPPISKSEMLTASNDEVLRVIAASRNSANSERRSTEVEGGWEEPGGSHSAGLQIAELAKENPQRAIELIRLLVANGIHDAAAEPIHSLSETSLSDEEVFAFVRSIASFDLLSEQVRSNLGYLLHRRCRNHVGLPDDICEMLRVWLSMPFDLDDSAFLPSDSQNAEREPTTVTSILWSTSGGHFNYGRSFWPLLAVTHGYLTRSPAETTKWLDVVEEHLSRNISERTWTAYCSALGWIRLIGSDHKRGEATISLLFRRFPSLCLRQEGVRLLGHVSDLLSASFLRECLNSLRASTEFTSRQAFGELLTLIALRDENHGWARDWITSELAELTDFAQANEPIAVGVAFAAAHLWDEPQARTEASRLLCHLVPSVTNRTGQAIGTVFWAQQDFAADEATEQLLRAFAKHPQSFAKVETSDLIEHLAGLLPHKRELVLRVCQAILKSGREEYRLFEFGRNLVDIAMTLQRFSDTRDEGLALLEELLRLGLDDAFNILREIDIRPTPVARREPRIRRRRRRGGSA